LKTTSLVPASSDVGGGSGERGRELVDYAFEKGLVFKLVDIDELKDDEML
jgi:hypothetical protein